MSEPVKVKQADAFNSEGVLVTLSDDRVLLVTLDQILSAQPEELPPADEEEDLTESIPE